MRNALSVIIGLTVFATVIPATAGGGYFSDLDTPVVQPGQEILVHWNAKTSHQTLVIQPEFQADSPAQHFGIVIPTPHKPEVSAAPESLFVDLLAWTALTPKKCRKRRPRVKRGDPPLPKPDPPYIAPTVTVLASGTVGSVEWKTLRAQDAASLYDWLKANKYNFAGDEETLESYVRRYWVFTVVKANTAAAPLDKSGRQHGRVAPVQLTFKTSAPILPLAPVQGSVRGGLDTLFYIVGPNRMNVGGGEVEYARKVGKKDTKRIAGGMVEIPHSVWDPNVRKHDFKALAPYLGAGTYLTKVRRRFDTGALVGELAIVKDKSNREFYTFADCGIEQAGVGDAVAPAKKKPAVVKETPKKSDKKAAKARPPKDAAKPEAAPASKKSDGPKEAPASKKAAPKDAASSAPAEDKKADPPESGSGFIDE
jgi:hypothetical protein